MEYYKRILKYLRRRVEQLTLIVENYEALERDRGLLLRWEEMKYNEALGGMKEMADFIKYLEELLDDEESFID